MLGLGMSATASFRTADGGSFSSPATSVSRGRRRSSSRCVGIDSLLRSVLTRIIQVAAYLDTPDGPIRRYTPPNEDLDSVIEVLTIISNPRVSVEPNAFPAILWPARKPYGSRGTLYLSPHVPSALTSPHSSAYDKLYADDASPVTPNVRGEIYKNLGIDPKTGCIAVVRPDQTVSLVCALDEHKQIGEFFAQFMVPLGGRL